MDQSYLKNLENYKKSLGLS